MEMLAQVSPAIVLGVIWPRLTARRFGGRHSRATLAYLEMDKLWGFHAGLLGWALNLLVCFTLSVISKNTKP